MIKKIQIQNFQSHKETTLRLDPGVNIIVGTTDSGKTSILRALRWVIWNRPSGDDFRSWWGGNTSVEVIINERNSPEPDKDFTSIIRSKSDKNNQYFLNGTDNVFKAIGTDVPQEVKDILNVSEVNLQRQLDSPFLLTETPGNVAKHFNKIAHLDIIDTSVSNISSWIRGINGEIKHQEKSLVELKEAKKKFKYLKDMEKDVLFLEEKKEEIDKLYNDLEKLSLLELKLSSNDQWIQIHTDEIAVEPELDDILSLFTKMKSLKEKQGTLYHIRVKLVKLKNAITEGKELIKAESDVDEILTLYEDLRIAKSDQHKINKKIKAADIIQSSIKLEQLNLKRLENKMALNMPDVCPLCETKLK